MSHELLGFMSPSLAADILSYTYEADKPLYRATLGAVAEARKVRPVFLERQPRAQRHTTMLSALTKPSMEMIAGNMIRSWLVKKQNAVLVEFLNALEIPHKEGVVDDLPPAMDDAKLRAAVEGLLAKHPHEVVAVYLLAFNEMNEANWPNLKALLETDSRLQLGAQA
ncbi:MAG: hypothetical protein JWQ71_3589 [Pedosphaera sp.]|nr:hypothetical protein [Pedosphaera sp.]